MPNIQDHALQIGGQRLAERAFDALDSLILTQLVYMPFEGFLDRGKAIPSGNAGPSCGTMWSRKSWTAFSRSVTG